MVREIDRRQFGDLWAASAGSMEKWCDLWRGMGLDLINAKARVKCVLC